MTDPNVVVPCRILYIAPLETRQSSLAAEAETGVFALLPEHSGVLCLYMEVIHMGGEGGGPALHPVHARHSGESVREGRRGEGWGEWERE